MKLNGRPFLIAPLFFIIAACSTVQGVVRDKPTGSPISSATVTIKNASATTNAYGAYLLQGTWLPQDTMLINAPGYHIYTKSVGTELVHDIELTPRK